MWTLRIKNSREPRWKNSPKYCEIYLQLNQFPTVNTREKSPPASYGDGGVVESFWNTPEHSIFLKLASGKTSKKDFTKLLLYYQSLNNLGGW